MSKKGVLKLPYKNVKIGPFLYKVLMSTFKSGVHGETNTDTKQIQFSEQTNIEVLQDTFLHECLHALCEDIIDSIDSIDKAHDKEEQLVRLLSPRLLLFIKENPKWIEWLWKKKSF